MAADRYTIISADTHAGGSHEQYREYLDPAVPRRLRRLAGRVQEPVEGPARHRPAHPQLGRRPPRRRPAEPTAWSPRSSSRTRCRPSSRASCSSPARRRPRSTSTAAPASTPTTAGWSTSAPASPSARAGIGQIFLNDVDDAIEDVTWIKEHGLRGGVLLPDGRPRREVGRSRSTTRSTTRSGRHIQDLEIPLNLHSGTGSPDYGKYAATPDAADQRGRLLRQRAARALHPRRACSSASRASSS